MLPGRSTHSSAIEYCRQARRLRGHFDDPAALHARLRRLHGQAIPPASQSPELRFESLVVRQIELPVLRYSRRTALIRQAEKMGVGRFQANLIIAQVQYRMTHGPPAAPRPVPPSSRKWLPAIGLFLAVESALASALWFLLA